MLAKAKQGQEERNSTTVAEDAADGEANAANIRFATDSIANVANANNKNKSIEILAVFRSKQEQIGRDRTSKSVI